MKTLICAIAGCFLLLFVVTTFIPYPAAQFEATGYFSQDEIDTGLQFTFERRLFMWAGVALEFAVLGAFSLTGLGRWLADRFLAWTGQRRVLAALGVGFTVWIVHDLLYLPLGIARLEHAHAWGMSNLGIADWLRDHYVSLGVGLITDGIVLAGFYALLIWLPRVWWLVAPFAASALAIAYAFLAPILINPLFNDFTPLEQTEWRGQQPRVQALIDKAGVPVQEILVMNGSRQSNHTNAYFAGFGPTRRIVLYDTLLKNHTPDEIESVLAHEIGHWQHDHITKGILLGTLAAVFGCLVLDRLLRRAIGRPPWQLQSIADPAGVPLVLLLMFLGSWIAMPIANLVSRHFERQADETSLTLADVPATVFITTEQKLARVNKANVAPTPWNVWLFSSHPPTVERIRMAEEWKKK